MLVNPTDWRRIRRNVEELGEPLTEKATTWAATALGAMIACALGLVSLLITEDELAAAVIVGFALATGFSLIFAVCFFLVGRTEKRRQRVSVDAVCDDMDDVAGAQDAPGPSATRG